MLLQHRVDVATLLGPRRLRAADLRVLLERARLRADGAAIVERPARVRRGRGAVLPLPGLTEQLAVLGEQRHRRVHVGGLPAHAPVPFGADALPLRLIAPDRRERRVPVTALRGACLRAGVGPEIDPLDGLEDRLVTRRRRAHRLVQRLRVRVHRGLGELVHVPEVLRERVAHALHLAPVAEAELAALRVARGIPTLVARLLDRLEAIPEALPVVGIPATPVVGLVGVARLELVGLVDLERVGLRVRGLVTRLRGRGDLVLELVEQTHRAPQARR
ncbi:MAG: hypothetical protein NT062_24920 [Proteobacteria bacterium]|nr:hypothetical protein [Pseudomonadota bacterium]